MRKTIQMTVYLAGYMLLFSCSPQHKPSSSGDVAANNKLVVKKGFEAWGNGVGNLLPIVADNVKWTIENYSEEGFASRPVIYHSKKELLENGLKGLYGKLNGIIKPRLKGLYAEGDMVIAHWQGTAATKDNRPFSNTYLWLMKLKDGKVIELTALLDMNVMNKLITDIPN